MSVLLFFILDQSPLQTLKRCKHPNVIILYAYNVSLHTSQQFVVYEYTARGSLNTHLDKFNTRLALSSDHRIRVMYQVARAIHFLHSGGVHDRQTHYTFFHRDIKLKETFESLLRLHKVEAAASAAELSRIGSLTDRNFKALAHLSANAEIKCPRLAWLAFEGKKIVNGPWTESSEKTMVKLYFICQHSFVLVDPPLQCEMTLKWVAQIAPALKVTLSVLSAPGLMSLLPPLGPEISSVTDFINTVLDAGARNILDQAKNYMDGNLDVDTSRFQELVGPAYSLIAEKTNKPKMSAWKEVLRPILKDEGTTIWVKKEFVPY